MKDAAQYGREWAKDYDEGEDEAYALSQASFIDTLARGGPVLEVAAGTGRVACRLKSSDVTATDASEDMLAVLKSKSSTVKTYVEVLPEVSGGPYSVIAILFNSLWVMLEAEDQRRFFINAAGALEPGGFLVVELGQVNTKNWDEPVLTYRGIRTVIYSEQFQRAQIKTVKDGKARYVVIRWTTDDEVMRWANEAGLSLFDSQTTGINTRMMIFQKQG